MSFNKKDRSSSNDDDGKCLCGCGNKLIQTNKYYIKKYIHGHNSIFIKHKHPLEGSNHPNWKGGKYLNQGYWYIHKPKHPFVDLDKPYIGEHRLIFEHYLKIMFDEDVYLPMEIDIHHINGNKMDNSLINLQALSKKEHTLLEKNKGKVIFDE